MSPKRATTTTELLLSIGGVVGRISLGSAPSAFLDQIAARYDAFRLPPADWVDRAFALRLTFVPAVASGPAGRTAELAAQPLTINASGRAIKASRWDFSFKLAPETFRKRARWAGTARCEMNPFALDSLLRVLWSTFLSLEGGALIHSCGLRQGDGALVFPGVSEAGKTTLARKMDDPDDVLSDEMVALRKDDDGQWRAHGTPFWGDFQRGGISLRSWPLRGVGFLKQGDAVGAAPLTSAEATLRLLECFVCFQSDAETARRNLAIAAGLCESTRCFEVQSRKETPAAEIMRRVLPHAGANQARRSKPQTTREMISEFRSFLKKNKTYAFKPQGGSMRPWLKAGDSLFIQSAGESEIGAGDILLYWSPGENPDDDNLTCHRMVGRLPALGGAAARIVTKGDAVSSIEHFENGRQSEILGKVSAVARDGKTWPMPGRVGSLARLFGSLVAMPILKMAGR
ncbi:MAG TPA: hypothetical protein VH374_21720 [Polyangia bacterium]|jgi:hypothetical protein|nr:hypothetical protein [Polyangia bacterium]